MKKRTKINKCEYENYKKLFESVGKRSKKLHFFKLILNYQNNIKNTWNIIKSAIEKNKSTQSNLKISKKVIHKKKTITDAHLIAKHFNSYFTETDPILQIKSKNLL